MYSKNTNASRIDAGEYKYVGPPNFYAEMYAGRIAYCPWWVTGQTGGQTPDRYIMLSARRGQRTNR